jgi:hypothetical protein
MTFIAKDLAAIALAFDQRSKQALLEGKAAKSFARRRSEGEAYAWEQAARLLREVKWAADAERFGSAAPFAVPRDKS